MSLFSFLSPVSVFPRRYGTALPSSSIKALATAAAWTAGNVSAPRSASLLAVCNATVYTAAVLSAAPLAFYRLNEASLAADSLALNCGSGPFNATYGTGEGPCVLSAMPYMPWCPIFVLYCHLRRYPCRFALGAFMYPISIYESRFLSYPPTHTHWDPAPVGALVCWM